MDFCPFPTNHNRYFVFSFSALSIAALAQPCIASMAIHIALQKLRQWDNIVRELVTQEHKWISEIGVWDHSDAPA